MHRRKPFFSSQGPSLYPIHLPSTHHLHQMHALHPAHLLNHCLITKCWEKKMSLVATYWFLFYSILILLITSMTFIESFVARQPTNTSLFFLSACPPLIGTTPNSLCGIKIKPSKEWQSNPTIYLYIHSLCLSIYLSIYPTFVLFTESFHLFSLTQYQTQMLMLMAAWHFPLLLSPI